MCNHQNSKQIKQQQLKTIGKPYKTIEKPLENHPVTQMVTPKQLKHQLHHHQLQESSNTSVAMLLGHCSQPLLQPRMTS